MVVAEQLLIKKFCDNDVAVKETAEEMYEEVTGDLVREKRMSSNHKALFMQNIKDVKEGLVLSRGTQDLEIVAKRKAWLILTWNFEARDIDVAMLV